MFTHRKSNLPDLPPQWLKVGVIECHQANVFLACQINYMSPAHGPASGWLSELVQKERAGDAGSFLFLKNGKLAFAAQGNQTRQPANETQSQR